MWALIDNYDSFTFILRDYLLQLHDQVTVFESSEITIEQLSAYRPEKIILSPGPGSPYEAGITLDIIRRFHQQTPILGICLGHQALGVFFGASLRKSFPPVHGKVSKIAHYDQRLFSGIPQQFGVMRYHSLAIENWEETPLVPLAFTHDHTLMALKHKKFPSVGFQFHPESILTQYGHTLLKNWAHLY